MFLKASKPSLKLPPEILIQIFESGTTLSTCRPGYHLGSVVSTSQVCSTWRILCLRTPSLWQQICLHQPMQWIIERLVRAKDYPVVVYDSCEGSPRTLQGRFTPKLDVALSHAGAIRSLDLFTGAYNLQLLSNLLLRPFPDLESFSLIHFGDMNGDRPFSLPWNLFQRSAPALRMFTAINCGLPLLFLSLPNLTNLTLILPSHCDIAASSSELHTALRMMPRLEALKIEDDSGPTPVFDGEPPVAIIQLDFLREFTFKSHRLQAQRVLYCMKCPALTNISVRFELCDPTDASVSGLTRFLSALRFGPEEVHSLLLAWYPNHDVWKMVLVGPNEHHRLSVAIDGFQEAFQDASHCMALRLCRALDLQNLSVLTACTNSLLSPKDYVQLFGALPLLGIVNMKRFSSMLVESLGPRPAFIDDPTPASAFPALRRLSILQGPFNHQEFTALKTVLQYRSGGTTATKLDRLTLSSHRLTNTQMEYLKSVVLVEWNEHMFGASADGRSSSSGEEAVSDSDGTDHEDEDKSE